MSIFKKYFSFFILILMFLRVSQVSGQDNSDSLKSDIKLREGIPVRFFGKKLCRYEINDRNIERIVDTISYMTVTEETLENLQEEVDISRLEPLLNKSYIRPVFLQILDRNFNLLKIEKILINSDKYISPEKSKALENLKSEDFFTEKELKEKLEETSLFTEEEMEIICSEAEEVIAVKGEIIKSVLPEERATVIIEILESITLNESIDTDELIRVENKSAETDILCGTKVIMTITEEDAKFSGKPREKLAEEYRKVFQYEIKNFRSEREIKKIALSVIYSIITTVIFIFLFLIADRIFRFIYGKLETWCRAKIWTIQIGSITRLTSAILYIVKMLVKIISAACKVIIFYIYLIVVLGFFVWTRGVSEKLSSCIEPLKNILWQKICEVSPGIAFILIIVIFAYYIIGFVRSIFNDIENENIVISAFPKEWAGPTYKIVSFFIAAFAFILILPNIPGYETPAFKGVGVFLGLIFSLSSATIVANILSGITLTYMNAFQKGDKIEIADIMGIVAEKKLLGTCVKTVDNTEVFFPNSRILNDYIVNYGSPSKKSRIIVNSTVTIGYDSPWRKVHKLLIDAALSTGHILKDPPPFVFQKSLDDFYVSYNVKAFTEDPDILEYIVAELNQNIQDKFNEEGLEIMSPHYRSLRDGNHTTVPAEYLSDSYSPGSFRLNITENSKEKKPQ